MKKIIALLFVPVILYSCSSSSDDQKKKDEAAAASAEAAKPAADKPTPAAEIGDPKYIEIGKAGQAALAAGNLDTWLGAFADNAVYVWNNGDSLVGKAAITKYWKDRMSTTVDSLSFTNQIWLPLKVNKPQSVEAAGVWLEEWYMVRAKYKTGKAMMQWMQVGLHFDANDKIDRLVQFRDQLPIMAAMKK